MAKTTESRRYHAITIALATLALFSVLMTLLVWRLEAGVDPAIGAQAPQPEVVQRKLIVKRKVVEIIEPRPVPAATQPAAAAPQTTYSAPATTSAPQVSVPAPAPQPAPTTKAS